MAVPFVESDSLSENLVKKILDFNGDTFKWVFSANAPTAGTVLGATVIALPALSTAGGYTAWSDGAGGHATTLATSHTGGTQPTTVSHTTAVFTASGAVGPFRYVILVDDTPTSPLNPVIGYFDHTSNITMASGDTYTISNGAVFVVN